MITRYRVAVAVLLVSLTAVGIAYYQQTQELAYSRFETYEAQAEAKRSAALLRISETNVHVQADANEAAASRLRAVEAGYIVPVGTRRAVEQMRARGELAP